MTPNARPLRLFLVVGEHSGDQLGARLLSAIRKHSPRPIEVSGVGGEAMAREGLVSLFPLSDVAVMGPIAILRRLRPIIARVRQSVDAAVAADPDVLIIIDSPEFTHPVARRVRRKMPDIPVIDYVSPSIWAWRPGRARKMSRYVDHVLALLPFEPEAHERLGGPACTYVGHPLIERLDWIRSRDGERLKKRLGIPVGVPLIAVLPGSRRNEIARMMPVYGETLARIMNARGSIETVIPVAEGMEGLVEDHIGNWPMKPHLLRGEEDKYAAFRAANAALATSGTVTLELALAGTPMVVGYRTEFIVAVFRWMLQAHSIVLPNLVLGENAFPEFIQNECSPGALSAALQPLLDPKSDESKRQGAALKTIASRMKLPSGTPSEKAARIVLEYTEKT